MSALLESNEFVSVTVRRAFVVTLIFACALVLRLALIGEIGKPLVPDEAEHDALARQIIAGKGYVETLESAGPRTSLEAGKPTAWRTPGFPLVLAAIYRVTGENPGLARIVLVLITSFTVPLLCLLGQMLFNKPSISIVAGFGWAALPASIDLSQWLLGEESAALVVVASLILVILSERKQSAFLACLAGLLSGFAILIRGFLILPPLAFVAWLLIRKANRLAAVMVVSAALLPVIWSTRNALVMGIFSLSTQTPVVIWSGNNAWARGSWPGNWEPQHDHLLRKYPNFDDLDEVERSRVFGREAWLEVTENPGRILWLLPRKFLIFFSPASWIGMDWVYAALLPFSIAGLLLLYQRREDRHILWLLGGSIVGALAISLVTYADVRFRHPVTPMIVILASVGLDRIARGCL